eukprot:SAG22_NODE_30_length_28348_cov_12.488584_2_plen_470_part_00
MTPAAGMVLAYGGGRDLSIRTSGPIGFPRALRDADAASGDAEKSRGGSCSGMMRSTAAISTVRSPPQPHIKSRSMVAAAGDAAIPVAAMAAAQVLLLAGLAGAGLNTSHPAAPAEVFAYYLFGGTVPAAGWNRTVDWSVVTTVAAVHAPPDALVSAAHQHGRKVVLSVDPGKSSWFGFRNMSTELRNATARAAWVAGLAGYVRLRQLDGVNLDIEENFPANRAALVSLTAAVRAALPPGSQLSFATRLTTDKFAGSTANFDYPGLAAHCDFFFIMAYDYDKGGVYAASDSPIAVLNASVASYLKLGVPAQSLVLGLPLFATDYTCTTGTNTTGGARAAGEQAAGHCTKISPWEASITRRPIAGDYGGPEFPSPSVAEIVARGAAAGQPVVMQWDDKQASSHFDYHDGNGTRHQVWLMDQRGIQARVRQIVEPRRLRGSGAFLGDFLDFGPSDRGGAKAIWQALSPGGGR